jgi:hypothetical protein
VAMRTQTSTSGTPPPSLGVGFGAPNPMILSTPLPPPWYPPCGARVTLGEFACRTARIPTRHTYCRSELISGHVRTFLHIQLRYISPSGPIRHSRTVQRLPHVYGCHVRRGAGPDTALIL